MFASRVPTRSHRPRPALPVGLRQQVAPVIPASARTLPVSPALAPLLPGGALRRGTTTVVLGAPGSGAVSLGMSLLAEASARGHWCAAVGLVEPGISAMAELGLDLRRAVFVPRPRGDWAEAVAELLDGVELILLEPPSRVPHGVARRLVARAKERRASLVVIADRAGRWPIPPELQLRVTASAWQGAQQGDGRLTARRAEVLVEGRRGADHVRAATLWLPATSGAVSLAEQRR